MMARILSALLAAGLAGMLASCAPEQPPDPPDPRTDVMPEEAPEQDPLAPPAPEAPEPPEAPMEPGIGARVELGDGLAYEILSEGEGTEVVEEGSRVVLDTVLSLPDGTHLWSGEFPLTVGTTGQGAAIPGYDRGVRGMRLGEERRIHVPWQLGYGSRGQPPLIPGEQDLVFEVELTTLENP